MLATMREYQAFKPGKRLLIFSLILLLSHLKPLCKCSVTHALENSKWQLYACSPKKLVLIAIADQQACRQNLIMMFVGCIQKIS